MRNIEEKKIGVVAVDSGQLLICDPCYIDSEWQYKEFLDIRRYIDVEGKVYEYKKEFCNYAEILPTGKTPNDHIADGDWTAVPVQEKEALLGDFSYAGACETTHSEKEAGQLHYRLGHAGAGVVFSSGLGDGVYDVYATYADFPGWGRRIVSVRIELIDSVHLA